MTEPFDATGWLKWSEDEAAERIAPYYPAYLARRAQIDAAKLYPHNARFAAHVDGTGSDDEGTLIYLLQSWHGLQGERAQLAAFIERGAYKITPQDVHSWKPRSIRRGTIVTVGYYVGKFKTGYAEREDVRLLTARQGSIIAYIPPRKRTVHFLHGGETYFLPNGKEG